MNAEHARLRQFVLSWEDLDEADRRAADAHLADCEACRRLLAAFRTHELEPGPRGTMSEASLAEPVGGEPDDRARAEASRLALRRTLGLPVGSEVPAPVRRVKSPRSPRLTWLIPAAAAAIFLAMWFVWPRPAPEALLGEASAIHVGATRGESAGPGSENGVWRTGDAFAVSVQLARPAWPVVVLIGHEGDVSLLRPAPGDTTRLSAGLQRLGPSDPSQEWVLEDPPGVENLLVAGSSRPLLDRAALERELQRIEVSQDRAQQTLAVRELLARRFGVVRQVTLSHR